MYLNKLVILNRIIALFFICFILISCGIKYDVKKNQKTTDKIFEKEFKANHNAFEMSMDESNFSYVFSKLKNNETIWYRLFKGKIVETKRIISTDINFEMLSDLKPIDLNCKMNEEWNYILFFKIGDSISNTKFVNLKCLDSIGESDVFLDYLNNVITQGKPITW